jgi:hypothetical protein
MAKTFNPGATGHLNEHNRIGANANYLEDYGGLADANYTDGAGNYFSDAALTTPATDNITAMRNAITAIPAGGILRVRGRYYFAAQIEIDKKMELRGDCYANDDGPTQLLIKDPTTKNGIVIQSAGVRIDNLYVRGFDTSAGAGILSFGESQIERYNTYVQIENCWSVGFNKGFYLGDTYLSSLRCCTAGNNAVGFMFSNATTTLDIKQCWALNNSGHGFMLTSVAYSTLQNCAADQNGGSGYHLDADVRGVNFLNCGAEANALRAIYCKDGHCAFDGFVSVANGASDAESTFGYFHNSRVSLTNSHEHSQPAGSLLKSIINNESQLNLDMSLLQNGVFNTAGAVVYGNVFAP